MAEITITNISTELVNKINSLTKQSGYENRSAFLIAALQDYCLYHNEYFMHCLPDTVRILAEDAMKKEEKQHEELLRYSIATINASNKMMEQLFNALTGENDETEEGE